MNSVPDHLTANQIPFHQTQIDIPNFGLTKTKPWPKHGNFNLPKYSNL